MPISTIKGDLFGSHQLQALAHGCNCAGAMGKGIALEFRKRFPRMFQDYRSRCLSGQFNLGDVFPWTEDCVTIFNLGTQRTWRTHADADAIRCAVDSMVMIAENMAIDAVGLPRVGTGLGGLSWEVVYPILSQIGMNTTVELRIFEK